MILKWFIEPIVLEYLFGKREEESLFREVINRIFVRMNVSNFVKEKIKFDKNKIDIKPVKFYFVIGSSKFLLKNEPLEEMLRERAQFLKREKKPITFWLIKSPKFLDSIQLDDIRAKLSEAGLSGVELTAIVSLDETFTTWLKLRLQNVGEGHFMTGKDIDNPLASKF